MKVCEKIAAALSISSLTCSLIGRSIRVCQSVRICRFSSFSISSRRASLEAAVSYRGSRSAIAVSRSSTLLRRTSVGWAVITAHPTEVRRKSVLDRETAIADLLPRYDTAASNEARRDEIEKELKRQIRTLWQTRMLRPIRLHVSDEIDNAAAIFSHTFIPQLPVVKRRLAKLFGLESPLPRRLVAGSWVGGDREGNPFVTAATLDYAGHRLSEIALDHYLEQVHALGGELSLSDELVRVSKDLDGLASKSANASAHKADEPYRRVLTLLYARLAATRKTILGRAPSRAARGDVKPYSSPREFADDLRIIANSLIENGSGD